MVETTQYFFVLAKPYRWQHVDRGPPMDCSASNSVLDCLHLNFLNNEVRDGKTGLVQNVRVRGKMFGSSSVPKRFMVFETYSARSSNFSWCCPIQSWHLNIDVLGTSWEKKGGNVHVCVKPVQTWSGIQGINADFLLSARVSHKFFATPEVIASKSFWIEISQP